MQSFGRRERDWGQAGKLEERPPSGGNEREKTKQRRKEYLISEFVCLLLVPQGDFGRIVIRASDAPSPNGSRESNVSLLISALGLSRSVAWFSGGTLRQRTKHWGCQTTYNGWKGTHSFVSTRIMCAIDGGGARGDFLFKVSYLEIELAVPSLILFLDQDMLFWVGVWWLGHEGHFRQGDTAHFPDTFCSPLEQGEGKTEITKFARFFLRFFLLRENCHNKIIALCSLIRHLSTLFNPVHPFRERLPVIWLRGWHDSVDPIWKMRLNSKIGQGYRRSVLLFSKKKGLKIEADLWKTSRH